VTNTLTNRHGDEIRIGQLWTDDPRRAVVLSLRIDGLDDASPLGAVAVCTLVQAHDTVPWRPARQFAVPLVCAFLPMAAMVALFMIGMELFFTPD